MRWTKERLAAVMVRESVWLVKGGCLFLPVLREDGIQTGFYPPFLVLVRMMIEPLAFVQTGRCFCNDIRLDDFSAIRQLAFGTR